MLLGEQGLLECLRPRAALGERAREQRRGLRGAGHHAELLEPLPRGPEAFARGDRVAG